MASAPDPDAEKVAPLYHYPIFTPCDLCDTKENVNSFCRNCSQNLCDVCRRSHLRSTVSRDHNVVHISEGKTSDSESAACAKHGQMLFFYCRTCCVLFCQKCLIPSHRDHDFLGTDEYADELQSTVALMIEEKSKRVEEIRKNIQCIEESKKRYADACTKCKRYVMENAKFLHSEVERVLAERLSSISSHESQVSTKYDEAKHQEKLTEDKLQESLDTLIRHSKNLDNISLVAYASKLSIADCQVKKNDKSELDSQQDNTIPSYRVPRVGFRSSIVSENAISNLFGTLHFEDVLDVDIVRTYSNEGLMLRKEKNSKDSELCSCKKSKRLTRYRFSTIKCPHCNKPLQWE
ncbi:hypothetical protein FSP39_002458 [Pinctada imbricata]|uniref:B box-type domain-containing protein n=1 Tax=Pinctada imbricata TaxID=66713 RepID=A0AA89BHK5_PINIB|nr:hypothetical protein FSP39_002458 [Pinctada imbricata]